MDERSDNPLSTRNPSCRTQRGRSRSLPWRSVWPRLLVVAGCIALIVQGIRIIERPQGDFPGHWESGRRIAAGEPLYAPTEGGDPRGHNYPYPPSWAMAHAPVSFLPLDVAQVVVFPMFILSFWQLLRVLRRMTDLRWPLSSDTELLVAAVAGFLTSRYLVRDMLECGVNLLLVTLAWTSLWLWQQHRDRLAGWVLGLAIALKCTPGLFAAYFVWKRQWRVVGWTVTATAVFLLAPALLLGPSRYISTTSEWLQNAVVRTAVKTNGISGVLGVEPIQNMSLKPALMRYLVHVPPNHAIRRKGLYRIDFLDFPRSVAKTIARLAPFALLALVAFCFRTRVQQRDDPRLTWEFASVSVLILLLSPITWGQHCVGLFPAFYLLKRREEHGDPAPRWINGVLWAFIIGVLILNRGILGKQMALTMDSYWVQTWLIVAVLITLVDAHRRHQPLTGLNKPNSVSLADQQHPTSLPLSDAESTGNVNHKAA